MNSLCRALARIAFSQSTRRNPSPPFILLQSFYSASSFQYLGTNETTTATADASHSSTDWRRPTEIPFQPKIANSVSLIGHLDIPILSQHSADGKFFAATIITQKSNPPSFRIPIVFEGDLAHIAVNHLKKNNCVFIAGKFSADPPPVSLNCDQAQFQIVVHRVNFVHGYSQANESWVSQQQEGNLKDSVNIKKDGDSALDPWRDLVRNPKEWWDYRSSKLNRLINPKYPDFKKKDGSLSLWLNRAPRWILSELERVELDVQIPKSKQVKHREGTESWKDLVENPEKWWDNRMNKKNVKAPDFKHKENGEGLWLDSSPAWVLPKLPPLKHERKNITA